MDPNLIRPYTRSLDPQDYEFLRPVYDPLKLWQASMVAKGVPHRDWHPHRFWEYSSILQQLYELNVPFNAKVIDIGSGGCFFAPYLAVIGWDLSLTDSMKYGDITPMVQAQRDYYGISLPLYDIPLEDMSERPDVWWSGLSDFWDVTLCISTIEHVDDHDAAMREMVRITKPGGYIFITSDYFRDLGHFEQSISRHLQVTPYREEFVLGLPERFGLEFVGETDLAYRGDFVHNYSFCNVAMRKPRAVSTSTVTVDDNGKAL